MFFIVNEIISAKEAAYPTHSVIVIPKSIVYVCIWAGKDTYKIGIGKGLKKETSLKESEENCYEKDGKLWNLPMQRYKINLSAKNKYVKIL